MNRLLIPGVDASDFFARAESEIKGHPVLSAIATIGIADSLFHIEFNFFGRSRVEYRFDERHEGIYAERHSESIALTHQLFHRQIEDLIFHRIREFGAREI